MTARRSSSTSEARLAASIEGPDGAPVVILANPIGITRLRVIRGASHLAPYQTPGPVTAAIRGHLAGS